MDPDQVQAHEEWYVEYLRRSELNKIEIRKWKEEKDKMKTLKAHKTQDQFSNEIIIKEKKINRQTENERRLKMEQLARYKVVII